MSGDVLIAIQKFQRDGLQMHKAVASLLAHAEQSYGLFRDSTVGWHKVSELLENAAAAHQAEGLTREQVLRTPLVHGKGTPERDGIVLHKSTMGDRLAACAEGGQNEITLSNLTLISIYAFWEDRTRGEIAKALGIDKDSVESDLFGDMAKLRNIILHAGGVMDQRARSLRLLRWFVPGDKVIVNADRLHEIIVLIRQFPEGLRTIGYDPAMRP